LGYKAPEAKHKAAVENTKMMFDIIKGFEEAAKKK
jgi:hypothetical protein